MQLELHAFNSIDTSINSCHLLIILEGYYILLPVSFKTDSLSWVDALNLRSTYPDDISQIKYVILKKYKEKC